MIIKEERDKDKANEHHPKIIFINLEYTGEELAFPHEFALTKVKMNLPSGST